MIQKDDHPFLVLEYKRIDDLHVGFLDAKLDQVRQVLETLGEHDEWSCSRRWWGVGDEIELSRIEEGRTKETEEDEAGDGAGLHQALVRPLVHHVAL